MDRGTGRGVRISFVGPVPGHEERKRLRAKIDEGVATVADERRFSELRDEAVAELIHAGSEELFRVTEIQADLPPETVPVSLPTVPCMRRIYGCKQNGRKKR